MTQEGLKKASTLFSKRYEHCFIISSVFFLQIEKITTGNKRHTPITFGNDSPTKRIKDESKGGKREIYTPPSGKYSSNISANYGNRGRFRGNRTGGRGGFRQRGRAAWRKSSY